MRSAAGYVPEWLPAERGADAALLQIAAHYLQAIARRLNQAPDKNKLAFLELAGVRLVPAQPARAPVVFVLADDAADVRLPAGTRLAAPPPPGGTAQIIYETERSSRAGRRPSCARWSACGRGATSTSTTARPLAAGQPFQPFRKRGPEEHAARRSTSPTTGCWRWPDRAR